MKLNVYSLVGKTKLKPIKCLQAGELLWDASVRAITRQHRYIFWKCADRFLQQFTPHWGHIKVKVYIWIAENVQVPSQFHNNSSMTLKGKVFFSHNQKIFHIFHALLFSLLSRHFKLHTCKAPEQSLSEIHH